MAPSLFDGGGPTCTGVSDQNAQFRLHYTVLLPQALGIFLAQVLQWDNDTWTEDPATVLDKYTEKRMFTQQACRHSWDSRIH